MRFEYQLIGFSLLFTAQVYGSCFFDVLKSAPPGGRKPTQYCEYSDKKHAINSTWNLPYPDCFNCQCNKDGLQCCGYGIAAGAIVIPESCQLVEGTCDVIIVRKDDPCKLCDKSQSTQAARRFEKECRYKRQSSG